VRVKHCRPEGADFSSERQRRQGSRAPFDAVVHDRRHPDLPRVAGEPIRVGRGMVQKQRLPAIAIELSEEHQQYLLRAADSRSVRIVNYDSAMIPTHCVARLRPTPGVHCRRIPVSSRAGTSASPRIGREILVHHSFELAALSSSVRIPSGAVLMISWRFWRSPPRRLRRRAHSGSWPGALEFTLNEAEPAQMRALAGRLRSPQTVEMVTLPPGQQGGVPCGRGLVGIGRDSSSRHVTTPSRSSPRV